MNNGVNCPVCNAAIGHRELVGALPCPEGDAPVTRVEFEALKAENLKLKRMLQCLGVGIQ